ncbi:hypothetical protein [Hymenobacter sp. B81]|uniref:hypothetical protein n=1 Tax=Hymenobacter sp. B81 TaxID=3344878 RepID=UPI0037DCEA21
MARPKAKSPEEKQAALDQLLSMAATTNLLTGANTTTAPAAPASAPATEAAPAVASPTTEQKGEKTAPTAATSEPAPAPEQLIAAPATDPVPAPATEPVAAPVASQPEAESAPQPASEAIPEPASAVEVGALDLASLFVPAAEKKVFTMRLTDAHYQYLLLLGTIVGNGASPPDIVHNILRQFIDRHDTQIQKAINKQLRQRQGKK